MPSEMPSFSIGSWIDYVPTLKGSTGDPTMGTGGTIQAAKYVLVGTTLFYKFSFRFGTSGMAGGSGVYEVTIPHLPSTDSLTDLTYVTPGYAFAYDNSANTWYSLISYRFTSDNQRLQFGSHAAASAVGSTTPFTWAAQDILAGTAIFEV